MNSYHLSYLDLMSITQPFAMFCGKRLYVLLMSVNIILCQQAWLLYELSFSLLLTALLITLMKTSVLFYSIYTVSVLLYYLCPVWPSHFHWNRPAKIQQYRVVQSYVFLWSEAGSCQWNFSIGFFFKFLPENTLWWIKVHDIYIFCSARESSR